MKDLDLQHYLRLALAQLQHKQKKLEAQAPAAEKLRLKVLEELIREQLPNENTRRSIGSAR